MAFSPREELGPDPKPSEFQSWFIKKTLKDISQSPKGWIGKLVKKLYLVFYGEELTPNSNLFEPPSLTDSRVWSQVH